MTSIYSAGKKSNNRKFPGLKGRRPDKAKFRQTEAKERQEAFAKLSNVEKIEILDVRLGKGLGAKKQRERLAK